MRQEKTLFELVFDEDGSCLLSIFFFILFVIICKQKKRIPFHDTNCHKLANCSRLLRWEAWSECSTSCGIGQRFRTRAGKLMIGSEGFVFVRAVFFGEKREVCHLPLDLSYFFFLSYSTCFLSFQRWNLLNCMGACSELGGTVLRKTQFGVLEQKAETCKFLSIYSFEILTGMASNLQAICPVKLLRLDLWSFSQFCVAIGLVKRPWLSPAIVVPMKHLAAGSSIH